MAEIKTAPVRLVELNPEWLPTDQVLASAPDLEPRSAIEFDCPCRQGKGVCPWVRIYLPIEGRSNAKVAWTLQSAEDFGVLTLAPSILARDHWHGYLRNGMLESC